jgi:mRNA degradation ribonuclease J1/J2
LITGDMSRRWSADVTRACCKQSDSEEVVKEVAKERADKTKNLLVVDFPMRAIARLQSFFLAAQTDRALVINLKQDVCLNSSGVWNCNLERKRYYLLSDLSGSWVIRCHVS